MSEASTHENADTPTHAFARLADYVALPRVAGLALSPAGDRLVTAVATRSVDGKTYATALWEIDPAGRRAPARLTRSVPGESQPVFLPDGGLLFTSRRPDPDRKDSDEDHAALWLLPATGGEARQIARRPGGIGTVRVAADAGDVVFTGEVLPGSETAEEDEKRRKARDDAGVTAILHEGYPVRFWDHDVGPGEPHVFAAGAIAADRPKRPASDETATDADTDTDLTPRPLGRVHGDLAVSADGTLIGYVVDQSAGPASLRDVLIVADRATGETRLTLGEPGVDYGGPAFAPDGGSLLCLRSEHSSWERPERHTLWLVDLDTGEGRNPAPDFPLLPSEPVFAPDGASAYFVADEQGRAPVFRLDLGDGSVTRLTASGAHSDVVVSRDGAHVYALHNRYDRPPVPVRLDPRTADQDPVLLPSPGDVGDLPGHLQEVRTTAADNTPLRGWLVLPDGASADTPAPLLLWIHGGPLSSWNSWSWRWNPWLMVARGYAVLLPDPGLSTGYGADFMARGWGEWGGAPYTDLMTITDAVCERDDIDADRTAAMGGSFGGYMANWVATQTDRFRAIVTHASLWNLEAFAGTTDGAHYWQREFGDPLEHRERYEANSPHLAVAKISTPMLVVHGDKDYRVPIGEGLRLWYDLLRHEVPAKFLYFPSENHWVLTPGNATVWYETVLAFLAEHVFDEQWSRPDLV